MNARVAKKILAYPVHPNVRPFECSPYSKEQLEEASRVFERAHRRCLDRETSTPKWLSVLPRVWRSRSAEGLINDDLYNKKTRKQMKAAHDKTRHERRKSRS